MKNYCSTFPSFVELVSTIVREETYFLFSVLLDYPLFLLEEILARSQLLVNLKGEGSSNPITAAPHSLTHLALWLRRREGSVLLLHLLLGRFSSGDVRFLELREEAIPGFVGKCRVFHQLSFDHQRLQRETDSNSDVSTPRGKGIEI